MKHWIFASIALTLAACGTYRETDERTFEDRRDPWRTQPEHIYPPYIVPYSPIHEFSFSNRRVAGSLEEKNEFYDLTLQDQDADKTLEGWPEASRNAARAMIAKYGPADGCTADRFYWYNKGPFLEIIVYKEGVRHSWPKEHLDVLEHVIAWKVPADRFDDLAMFDGSVIAERTQGTLAARCDQESMNILALNLAVDVATDKKSVEEARRFYEESVSKVMAGEKPEYTLKLQFQVPAGDTGDPDRAADLKK